MLRRNRFVQSSPRRRKRFGLRSLVWPVLLLVLAIGLVRMGFLRPFGVTASTLDRISPSLLGSQNNSALNRALGIAGLFTGINVSVSPAGAGTRSTATISTNVSRYLGIGQLVAGGMPEAQLEGLLSSGLLAELSVEQLSVDYVRESQELRITLTGPEEMIQKLVDGDVPLVDIVKQITGNLNILELAAELMR